MKRLFSALLLACIACLSANAQSSLFLRNSSWLDFDIEIAQKGSHTTDPVNFALQSTHDADWQEDTEVFTTVRDSTIMPLGTSVIYEIRMIHGGDTVIMDFKLMRVPGGTTFESRMHGNGYDTGFSADGNFHNAQVTIAGRPLELQYKADNDDAGQSMDVRLAIHEREIYHIDAADFANPNVMNVMAYNIQMLPLGVVGLPQAADRADKLPAQFSPYQDVVIFEEAFDLLPLYVNLIPAMEAAGFAHNSGILNNYLPFNGGVIIFSRWPIERTAEYDFLLCGPNSQDCLANKGIMYARVNKLGKPYNIFGTHFDAGSDSADIAAKTLQYAEMRNFIAAQGIPDTEPVIWGGDLNTDAANSSNLYATLRDSIDIVVPDYSGFPESNMSLDTGSVIDHVFADPHHLLPVEATVFITTFRSLESVLWDLSNFSDHRSAIARFRFPDLGLTTADQDLCPGASLAFQGHSDIPLQNVWYHDGVPMPGITGVSMAVVATTLADSGLYELEMRYSHLFGTAAGPVNQMMNPNGPANHADTLRLRAGYVRIGAAFCASASASAQEGAVELYPNPSNGTVHLRKRDGDRLDWQLSDALGRPVSNGVWTGTQMEIDLQGMSQGMYLLRLTDRKGARIDCRIVHSK